MFRGSGSKLRLNRDYLIVDGFVWEDIRIDGDNAYVVRFNSVNDCVFRNNVLRRVYNEDMDSGVVRIATSSDRNVIERNEFTGDDYSKDYRTIQLWAYKDSDPPRENVIRYNHFHDMSRAIQVGQGANTNPPAPYLNTVIEGNLFENMQGYTIHLKTSGNTFKNNTIRNARSAGDVRSGAENDYIGNYYFNSLPISLLYGDGEVRDNYMLGGYNTTDRAEAINLGWGDIEWPGISQANPAEDYLIANNTIIGFADAGIDFDLRKSVTGHDLPPENNHFTKNLVFNNAGKAIAMRGATNQTWEGNVVWSVGSGTPGDTPAGVLVADPGMQQNDFGLWYSSEFPDVGADVSRRPLTSADVGPGSQFAYVELAGDYNGDGLVNLADYSVWRDNLGASLALPNDETFGLVSIEDYQVWKNNLGRSAPTVLQQSSQVPELSTQVISILSLLVWVMGRSRSKLSVIRANQFHGPSR